MSEAPNVGDFIIVQRQSFMKLHKLSASGSVKLGKFVVLTDNVVGKPYWTTYRMEPKKDKKGVYNLIECLPEDDQCQVLMKDVCSGVDNRNIIDDGSSQKLSSEEIIGMKDEGLSSKEIVGTLIENSTTFQEKTEYSQEKYLKKKEKKYFEYVTIRKPTLRLIADIMYKVDPYKIMGLRSDTLSQLATAVNLQPHGVYIIYESGCQSLASAAILNGLSSEGCLILVHPSNNPQKQAIQGLNISVEDQKKLICVNIYTLLRKLLDCSSSNSSSICSGVTSEIKDSLEAEVNETTAIDEKLEVPTHENSIKEEKEDPINEKDLNGAEKSVESKVTITESRDCPQVVHDEIRNKRKHTEDHEVQVKKPRFEIEADQAVSIITKRKVDGLLVVCKEHPANILKSFLPFVGPSRNFVVYGSMREPLQDLHLEIRKRPDVVFVQLTEMWLRNYQVKENRTHPFVLMSGSGGYILTGIKIE